MKAIDLRIHKLGYNLLPNGACRLINSEGDGLSGLTVDRYGDYLCVQFTSLALYRYNDVIIHTLVQAVRPLGIFLRTEADILAEEGLELKDGLIYGDAPTEPLTIDEDGVVFEVNIATGQKTGFYCDQRSNRIRLGNYCAGNGSVLDLCTYTGGFALHAAKTAAGKVTAVDVSASALGLAKRNACLNGAENIEFVQCDMFKFLNKCLVDGRRFDTIILDPPKLTHSKSTVQNALKGYLQLNRAAIDCLNPGGIFVTCSCSGRISREDFLQMLNRASVLAGRHLRILEVRGADTDHPILSACPESEYLKCVICAVD